MLQQQIQQLYNPLFLYIKKRVNNQEDAEDLTQEVFFKLSKSDSSKPENIKSWVYTIAKNAITDYYRKKKVLTEDVDNVEFVDEEEEDNKEAVNGLSSCVVSFINQLPEEYRSIMILSELENMPQKEIAETLGMNYTTVRSKVQRGRRKLKDVFTDCCTVLQGGKGSILGYSKNRPKPCGSSCS